MKNKRQELINQAIARNLEFEQREEIKIKNYPKITVIIPSFNQDKFLEETLLSIINQNYPNLELIIYDGGSTDNSTKILEKYDKHINFWISETDNGQADAINKGLKKSTGDLIGWLNSDDLYLPGSLYKVANAYINSNYADLIFGNCYLIDENSLFTWEFKYVPFSFEYLLYCGWNLSTQSAFWSRKIMKEIGEMKNLTIAFDYDWFLRITNRSKRVHFISSALGCYRIHKSSKFSMISIEDRIPVYANIRSNYFNDLKTDDISAQFRNKQRRLYFIKTIYHIIQLDIQYLLSVMKNKIFHNSPLNI